MNISINELKQSVRGNPTSYRKSLMEVEEEREIIHAIYQIDPTVHEDEVIKAVQKCRIDLLEAVKRELGLPA
jgi:hypothetical protein